MTFRIIFICLGCLFALPGLLLALYNWYSISVWAWRSCRDPQYRKGTGVTPFLGGILLFASVFPFVGWSVGWGLLVPWILDYGSLPGLVLTPLLRFLLHLRKAPAKDGALQPPFCKEVQLAFPLLLVGEDEHLELACNPEALSRKVAEQGAVLYADSLCQHVVQVSPLGKPSLWERLWHGSAVVFSVADVEYTAPRPYELSELINLQARLIREDDDALTQFHEATELLPLLEQCADFRELLALGCLAGWWEAPAGSGLPSLCESDLDIATIRAVAK